MAESPDPGEHRLARAPSDRYRATQAAAARSTGSIRRAVLYGSIASVLGALLSVLLGGALSLSAGLLVIWASAGHAIGLATRVGGGHALVAPSRTVLAAGLALTGVVLGQAGLWWYAQTEGGVLGLMDYLGQTYGLLVPVQAVLAVGFASWASR